jgi:proteic killer suppression protein
VIKSFANRGTEDIWHGEDTKAARKACDPSIWPVAHRTLDYLNRATSLEDLRKPPANKLHALKEDRAGQHAIRINDKYRVCFRWDGQNAHDVAVTDYH